MSINSSSATQCPHYAQSEIFTGAGMVFGKHVSNFVKTSFESIRKQMITSLQDPMHYSESEMYVTAGREFARHTGTVVKATRETLNEKMTPYGRRFAQLLISRDAAKVVGLTSYEKNPIEEAGDWALAPVVDFPSKVDNRVALAMGGTAAVIFGQELYSQPKKTLASVARQIMRLPRLAYLFTTFSLIGLACRSVGRLANSDLMQAFNEPKVDVSLLRPLEPVKAQSGADYSRFRADSKSCFEAQEVKQQETAEGSVLRPLASVNTETKVDASLLRPLELKALSGADYSRFKCDEELPSRKSQ